MQDLTIHTCYCTRDFIAVEGGCQEHCTPLCCRRYGCELATPQKRDYHRERDRRCVVCHRSNLRFPWERFSPCDSNCNRLYFHSPANYARSQMARGWHCVGVFAAEGGYLRKQHRPAAKPRLHRLYCSLTCYYHSTLGHDAKVRQGAKRRETKYWNSRGSRAATRAAQKEIDSHKYQPPPWMAGSGL